jgi:uncharacterized membrane protein
MEVYGMAPLIALVGGWLVLWLAGLLGIDALDGWQPALRGGLAVMFVLTGVAHFSAKRRDSLIAMVPRRLPHAPLLVTITGVLELNVSAARRKLTIADRPVTPLVPRTLLQVLFLAACVAAAL